MSLPTCLGCGEPLFRKSKYGPPPARFCSRRCRHIYEYHGAREAAEQRRWREVAEALDELAPYGLTDECPARREVAA